MHTLNRFLSYCGLPNHLPITIACHNAEKCWSASSDKRTSTPYSDYPNLILIHPPFPDSIAFGKERKNRGVGCHHPKFFVLQRQDAIRIVVTSANLVSRQWNRITNTVWWQDFPCRNAPDYLPLFTRVSSNDRDEDSISDFAAQLAGFMSSLVIDIPEQAYWISELAKYDYGGAVGHLIASIPGLHMQDCSHAAKTEHCLTVNEVFSSQSSGTKLLGSVTTFVVGISHRFRTATDLNGSQLKTMASLLGNCRQNACGMTEVILKRNTSIAADINAVGIFVTASYEFSDGDYVQLGFLPKDIAKWVSPLSDAGFFSFSACIFPKEAIAAALGGSGTKVQLILYGPNFSEIPNLIQPGQLAPLCSLLAHIQRCLGLWRLQEVLGRYRWPESLETDFWGCWTINHELKNASIRIIFPTIERVKNGTCGVAPSRFLLSLSEKTWQRLRNYKVFHDAIPHPGDRIGHPMHVKVACRRFQSKTDTSSFGWVYCGSHNFSPAAWGHLMQHPFDASKSFPAVNSSLGQRLHICNYELGVLFIVPPPGTCKNIDGLKSSLDVIDLPFVMPAPKYQHSDRPATTQAMREVALLERESSLASEVVEEMMNEEIPDEEEEIIETAEFMAREKEEEKIYAEMLWSQVELTECYPPLVIAIANIS
ncbi:hypothetical protein Taro_012382 [Colocasia esculenta]|uniref:HIRAN domain-containing protein n=1 Tax=Colocasia esculenta TaxID=4460 RepID=A0A843UJ14_COLES|nr:hypothetical protein [Colocasia esculenta]